jgi:uncharacterized membrane protein
MTRRRATGGSDGKPARGPVEVATETMSDHVVESVEALADFHLAHYRSASWLQRVVDRMTAIVGTPAAMVALSALFAVWIGGAALVTHRGVDQPAYGWLEVFTGCAALLMVVLVLATQRREDLLAERRGQLTLQLAILADKKSAKIIALLEELRRDHPGVSNRVDPQSEEMSTPTDVPMVLAAIDELAAASGLPTE